MPKAQTFAWMVVGGIVGAYIYDNWVKDLIAGTPAA